MPGTVAYPQPPVALATTEHVLRSATPAAPAGNDTALSTAAPQHGPSAVLLAWLLPLLAACAVCAVVVALVVARRQRADAFRHMVSFHDGLERREHFGCADMTGPGLEALPAGALVKDA